MFFAEIAGEMEFGLTRFFKIAHRYSVGAMRDRSVAHRRPPVAESGDYPTDFVETLFGYVFDKKDVFGDATLGNSVPPEDVARKGRIACGVARLTTPAGQVEVGPLVDTVMSAPRASFAPFYLSGDIKDYSADTKECMGLAGRKRYFPRFTPERLAGADAAIRESLRRQIGRARDNRDLQSHLRLLRPRRPGQEMRFEGELRLHNGSAAEIGALLWVLTHGGDPAKPFRHMFGHAKTIGAGQTRVRAIRLALIGNDAVADRSLDAPERWEQPDAVLGHEGWVREGQGMTPSLRAFHTWMRLEGHRPAWPEVPDMAEFLAISTPATGAAIVGDGGEAGDKSRYPQLEQRAFGTLRQRSKLSNSQWPPVGEPSRYLGVPVRPGVAPVLPYLGGAR